MLAALWLIITRTPSPVPTVNVVDSSRLAFCAHALRASSDTSPQGLLEIGDDASMQEVLEAAGVDVAELQREVRENLVCFLLAKA